MYIQQIIADRPPVSKGIDYFLYRFQSLMVLIFGEDIFNQPSEYWDFPEKPFCSIFDDIHFFHVPKLLLYLKDLNNRVQLLNRQFLKHVLNDINIQVLNDISRNLFSFLQELCIL